MKAIATLAGLLCFGLALVPPSLPPVPGGAPPARVPSPGVGSIRGRVEVRTPPPRRTADRYARRRSPGPTTIQPVPAVAWLEGAVPGDGGAAEGGGAAPSGSPSTLAQRDTAFHPAATVVTPGSTVEFPNRDPFFHNVFSYSSARRFDLGRYPRGRSKSVTFDEPGIVRVYCEVHESMRAVIVVAETPYHAVVDDDGSFAIPDVPAGSWTLKVWHPDVEPRTLPVEVPEGGIARVEVELR